MAAPASRLIQVVELDDEKVLFTNAENDLYYVVSKNGPRARITDLSIVSDLYRRAVRSHEPNISPLNIATEKSMARAKDLAKKRTKSTEEWKTELLRNIGLDVPEDS